MLMTDLRRDYIRTKILRADRVDPQHLSDIYTEMEAQALDDMRAEKVKESQIRFNRYADMRYAGQEHTVKVPIPSGPITPKQMSVIADRFHELHEHTYTFRLESPIELVNFHVIALGVVKKPTIPKLDHAGTLKKALKGERTVNFDELGFQRSAIYERARLPVGKRIKGPAVVEEPAAVTVVFPGQALTQDEYGFLHIEEV
jgi:N-methylhydantoinase A